MATTPAIIVAAGRRAQRRITAHFLAQHAIGPGDAVAFVPDRPSVQREFARMRARGVIHEVGKGTYWIDVAAYNRDIEWRRRSLVPIVIAVVVLLALVLTVFYRG